MKSMAGVTIAALLMTIALAMATQPSIKLRRDGVLNLYPFPRVGRSYWRVPLEEQLDHKPSKKSSLYAFPRVGRNDEAMRNQQLYLRLEPGGYRQLQSEPIQIRPELTQIRPEITQIRPELTQIRPGLAEIQPELAQILSYSTLNQQGSSNRHNYNQNPLGMSQSRSQFLQNQADLAQIRREISNLLENVYGKVKPRGLTKRESESELESEGTEGMWFGPRLGRSDKSIEYDESSEKNNVNTISPAITDGEQNGERERVKRKI